MTLEPISIPRPARWDEPFGPPMADADIERILTIPPFNRMDQDKFPPSLPLHGILRNDARLHRCQRGDILMRHGDYGSSAFFILSGNVRAELEPGLNPLPESLLGRRQTVKKSWFGALAQLWSNHRLPEVRDPKNYVRAPQHTARRDDDKNTRIYVQDFSTFLDKYQMALLGPGQLFGEHGALGRTPRIATVFADGATEILEIRWQGLRDVMRRDEALKNHILDSFRKRALTTFLHNSPLFHHLSGDVLEKIAQEVRFETHGSYEWAGPFKKMADTDAAVRLEQEPIIAEQGTYPNYMIMIGNGLARLSERLNHGQRTVSYLGPGQTYGFEEIAQNWRTRAQTALRYSLRAVGYVDILLVPTAIVEEYVLKQLPPERLPLPLTAAETKAKRDGSGGPSRATPLPLAVPDAKTKLRADGSAPGKIPTGLLEFLVEGRYINGTASMVIDLDRCTRCDDCVRACSKAHDNNPRFLRHGPKYSHYMVANACMHCQDPVCMIECPTGAIHRETQHGMVVINDATCIGCSACANNCPYDAIRMVEIRDASGNFIVNRDTNAPIQKATKCDLCVDQLGGPACQRACPHDAMRRVDMRDTDSLAQWLNR